MVKILGKEEFPLDMSSVTTQEDKQKQAQKKKYKESQNAELAVDQTATGVQGAEYAEVPVEY